MRILTRSAPCAIAALLAVLAIPAPAIATPDVQRMGKVEFDLALNVGGIATVGTKTATTTITSVTTVGAKTATATSVEFSHIMFTLLNKILDK